MRLDLFLKLSRLCPRRAIAQKLCDAGFVFVNGRQSKSAHEIKPGDDIVIRKPSEEIVARVQRVSAARNVSRKESRELVEIVSRKSEAPGPEI